MGFPVCRKTWGGKRRQSRRKGKVSKPQGWTSATPARYWTSLFIQIFITSRLINDYGMHMRAFTRARAYMRARTKKYFLSKKFFFHQFFFSQKKKKKKKKK